MAILGNNSAGSTYVVGSFGANQMYCSRFTLASAATLNELHGLLNPFGTTTNARIVIYKHVSGTTPFTATRVAYTNLIALGTGSTVVDVNQTGFSVALAAADYWIGYRVAGGVGAARGDSAGSYAGYSTGAADPPPDPFGTGDVSSSTGTLSCWAVVSAAASIPVADFTGTPTSGTASLSVTFTDASTNTPTSWAWTFGDGGTSTSQNPTHSYTTSGVYTVTLQATNTAGSNTKTRTGYVTVAENISYATGGGIEDLVSKQYDVPLQLTTPHMVGQKVKDAQWLMAGHNRYQGLATYKDGAVDGDYGPLTAQATYKAKYWLGYPDKSLDRSFGQTLYEYLLPKGILLPPDYTARRETRLAAGLTPGEKALEQAVTQLGNHETPAGSNMQKYGLWYGMNGVPWCAIFCSWCFNQSGYKGFRYAYVPYVHNDASASKNRLSVVRTPRAGDLVCFNFSGVRDAHIELFDEWVTQGSTFSTVGGNTGSASFNNGGSVERGTRYVSQVSAFVRVAA